MCALRYRKDRQTWMADVYANGKRQRIKIHKNDPYLSEAENHVLAERKYRGYLMRSGVRVDGANLYEYLQDYVEYCHQAKSSTTALNEKNRVWGILWPFFEAKGIISLNQITYSLLEKFVHMRQREGKKPATINNDIIVLRALLRRANELDLIQENPATKLKNIQRLEQKPSFYTIEELKKIMSYLRPQDLPIYQILVLTGIRRSELFDLTWDKVDFKRKVFFVGRKTYKERAVPMSPPVIDALKNLQGTGKGTKKVVQYGYIDTITRNWNKALKKAGVKGTLHDLRHTYASHLVQSGEDLYKVKELLGHSAITTTEIYAHLNQDNLRQANDKIATLLG